MRSIDQLVDEIRGLQGRQQRGEDVAAERTAVRAELAAHGFFLKDALLAIGKATGGGSRFAGVNASPDVVEHLAKGGSIGPRGEFLEAPGVPGRIGQAGIKAGATLSGVITKALAEATPSAGGYLVPPEVSQEIVKLIRRGWR